MTNDNLYRTIGNIEEGLKNLDSKVVALIIDVKKICEIPDNCSKLYAPKNEAATKSYVKKWNLIVIGMLVLLVVAPDLVKEALERVARIMF
jgi:hypothetical protein